MSIIVLYVKFCRNIKVFRGMVYRDDLTTEDVTLKDYITFPFGCQYLFFLFFRKMANPIPPASSMVKIAIEL